MTGGYPLSLRGMSLPVEIAELSVAELDACRALLALNHDECEAHHGRKLNIMWPAFYELEDRGLLHLFGAWREDQLIGYAVGVYSPKHPHHEDWSTMTISVIYVHPTVRRADVLDELMGLMRGRARNLNADSIIWQAKDGSPFDLYLERKAVCELLERTYEEKL